MITLQQSGLYKLIETKHHTKVLYLDGEVYGWVEPAKIGEILVTSHNVHKTDCVLSLGAYRIYDVVDEPELSDQLHLELDVGQKTWQGYLLPTGLPDHRKTRSRIIPTHEIIASNPRYTRRKELKK